MSSGHYHFMISPLQAIFLLKRPSRVWFRAIQLFLRSAIATTATSRFTPNVHSRRPRKQMRSQTDAGFFAHLPCVEDRKIIDVNLAIRYLAPAWACYYLMAVLVLLPSTRLYRVGLSLPSLWFTWAAATRCDMSFGDLDFNYLNYSHCVRKHPRILNSLLTSPSDCRVRPESADARLGVTL